MVLLSHLQQLVRSAMGLSREASTHVWLDKVKHLLFLLFTSGDEASATCQPHGFENATPPAPNVRRASEINSAFRGWSGHAARRLVGSSELLLQILLCSEDRDGRVFVTKNVLTRENTLAAEKGTGHEAGARFSRVLPRCHQLSELALSGIDKTNEPVATRHSSDNSKDRNCFHESITLPPACSGFTCSTNVAEFGTVCSVCPSNEEMIVFKKPATWYAGESIILVVGRRVRQACEPLVNNIVLEMLSEMASTDLLAQWTFRHCL